VRNRSTVIVNTSTKLPGEQLETLSRALRQLHSLLLQAEKVFHPPTAALELLDRLVRDPAWAWLRPLSALIADIDHVLAQKQPPTEYDLAVAAAHARELLANDGDAQNAQFLERYRSLLQLNPELVSMHGELKGLLKTAPAESADEADRLHHRHQWAMRCKHQMHG
jgi:hypothetical protein